MKILVCMKQVPQKDAPLKLNESGTWIREDLSYEVNEPDAYALEEVLADPAPGPERESLAREESDRMQSALAQLESGDDEGDLVASHDAIRMADELRRIDQSIGDDLPVDSGGSAISVARRRLETARAERAPCALSMTPFRPLALSPERCPYRGR